MGLRRFVPVAIVAVVAATAGVATAGRLSGWVWQQGNPTAYVGQPEGTSNLVLAAPNGDVNILATHVRMMSKDGVFRLEHTNTGPATLNAYFIGTPTRTPIQVGGYDTSNVTELIVAGTAGQTADLQQWALSGKVVAAIDAKGRLRLGGVTLYPTVAKKRVRLYAVTSAGKQLVAVGVPTR